MKIHGRYVSTEDMNWPIPKDIEWTLRFGNPDRNDILFAASIASSYKNLILRTRRSREPIIKILKQAIKGE